MTRLFTIIFLLFTAGCSNLGYYTQSIGGQLGILTSREPIEDLLEDDNVNPQLKQKLAFVLKARNFATQKLKLPEDGSYRSYVDTGKPYVVWNVFAAPEFSMKLNTWCFLFAGCISYRGYFDEDDAIEYAKEFNRNGDYDIYLRGVAAYSTLGWFDDPLLNTVIDRDEASLAGLIFHELAHQVTYIDNDSAFNESFAKTVELEGIRLWMEEHGTEQAVKDYEARSDRRKDFIALVTDTSSRLDALYATDQSADDMRRDKAGIIDDMKQKYEQVKEKWDGYNGYDNWFSEEINNAKIAAVTTYADFVPAFTALLRQHDNDFERFYRAVIELGELPEDQRHAKLTELSDF